MADLGHIEVRTTEYRPCYVDGKKALFHRWEDNPRTLIRQHGLRLWSYEKFAKVYSKYLETGLLPPEFDIEVIPRTLAIVEFEDGTVLEVEPCEVRFVPGLMSEYNFMEAVMNEARNGTD